ncbi:type VII secretion AAA-ATPase EccA [Mycobacteroides chelonae]|jgi:type VII secretion ATPase EccA|uniref:Type VII secretion AAA-ATPase EccA n=1 Tax=Mycobacteroides chelonae TaxID=1774 RepID=A0AB73LYM6_MYCCH|nr:type VII secretion AAA-ATPase EccA [Mycobacteroides chelonae]MBF9325205.1 type VII secretion AAA-ATPase EccA [Mycobacteroides chelonae]MBF9419381.1 type VII secretion AAA-ATPase EccA [Mycobacteroides chelonae]MBF9437860.1 type VII secretion AAA-ATPase EccA [Mycobacteroides chelonae]MBV6359163.1 type VII secretion AAA-ATPase EccA [Mycobacteroides chelonae]MEC4835239.1 type VII secretion AAA-ATPase EccA [Mycobacteroides chelonae]
MSGSRDAQRVFDAGVLSLGIPIDGLETDRDVQYAGMAFKRATEYDPEMSDAWLGRAAAGETTPEVLYHLYRTSKANLGRDQRRLGLPRNALAGRFQTGLYLDYGLSTLTEVGLAYAAGLIQGADYGEAEKVLNELDISRKAMPGGDAESTEICAYVRAVLHFTTQRWPDVLSALAHSAAFTDEYLAAGAHLMVGSACAQMGLFAEGIRRLDQAIEGPIPAARQAAEFCKGLTLREMGKEPEARVIFERIYSEDPGFEANAAALHDPKYRLIISTKESIDSRTDKWDPSTARENTDDAEEAAERGNQYLREAEEELNRQIGLNDVKLQVAKLRSAAKLAKVRGDKGLSSASRSLHLIFTGPPGTGKTTIARVVAQTYCGLGLLKTPNVVEAKRSDFVGEHLGSTAIKTSALIDSAMDGVLFIDEAYTLIQTGLSGGDAFGREAVDTLLARMENDRDRLVVIIAGYDAEIDRFLASNEGLASRFTKRIRFDSYSPTELGDIGRLTAQRRDSELSESAYDELVKACETLYETTSADDSGQTRRGIDLAGNGRFVRNVIEAAEEEREHRLAEEHEAALEDLDEAELMRIDAVDMRAALKNALAMLKRD